MPLADSVEHTPLAVSSLTFTSRGGAYLVRDPAFPMPSAIWQSLPPRAVRRVHCSMTPGFALGTFPGMAFLLGSIVFVTIVIGGLGSLWGALLASLLIGWMTTFAKTYNVSGADLFGLFGLEPPEDLYDNVFRDLWTMTLP